MEHGHKRHFASFKEASAAAKEAAAKGAHSPRVKRYGDGWCLIEEKKYPIGNELLWETSDSEEIDDTPF